MSAARLVHEVTCNRGGKMPGGLSVSFACRAPEATEPSPYAVLSVWSGSAVITSLMTRHELQALQAALAATDAGFNDLPGGGY